MTTTTKTAEAPVKSAAAPAKGKAPTPEAHLAVAASAARRRNRRNPKRPGPPGADLSFAHDRRVGCDPSETPRGHHSHRRARQSLI